MDSETITTMFQVAFLFFIGLIAMAAVLYLYPGSLYGTKKTEGFSTVALNTSDFPKCLARDAEAQALLADLKMSAKNLPPATDAAMAFQEFSLIVSKLLCMDADITSLGAGEYASLLLPFNTQHDMEPVGTFVGRCLKNAVRERDVSITLGKLQDRGNVLIDMLCQNSHAKAKAVTQFDGIVKRTTDSITATCLKPHSSMDIPGGVRDPGYYTSPELMQYGEYQNTAPQFHF